MIREKIFRLHKTKSSSSYSSAGTDASAQKFDFTFSNIQANQVPKGWDRIYVSLISSESGKTVRKSGKVLVKNGSCQWTETFSESIWISDIDSEYIFKFLLATGSSKSSILGETALNLTEFLSSESPVLVSLPLKNSNSGTVLRVEVKCLTPRTNPRDEKLKQIQEPKVENSDHDSIDSIKSGESLTSNNIGSSPLPMDAGSRETSFSASVSRYSFDSMDESVGRQSFSSQSERNGFGRQDSIESNESASFSSYSALGSVRSVRSLQIPFARNQREEFRKSCHAAATSLQLNLSSSKDGEDATAQELEAEARMWEQNARKLSLEMERLRNELSNQNLNITKINMELAASRLECGEQTQEIEQLKSLLQEFETKQNAAQSSELQELGQLEDEIRFQKEENEHLSIHLNKTQESNIELISVLQEMEETIHKQKMEIESLSASRSDVNVHVSYNESKSFHGCDSDSTISELELLNMQEMQLALQEKIIERDIEGDLKNRVMKEFVSGCNYVLAQKEQQIVSLEAALSSVAPHVEETKEIKQLKEKVFELKADCNELAEENIVLLYELNESRKNVEESEKTEILQEEMADLEDMDNEAILISSSLGSHVSDDKIDEMGLTGSENNLSEFMKVLSDLQGENVYLLQRVSGLEAQLRYLTDESESSRLELQHSESQVMIFENKIRRLEEENKLQMISAEEKLLEMEKKWLEAEEEGAALGLVNVRLQATTESIMEEYNTLQNFNVDLREQKMELQRRCMELESKARTFQECSCKSLLKEEITAGDQENLLIMFESMMDCESKLRSIINDLDLKIELSEVERLRLAEENSLLSMQLEKVSVLQNEILVLKISVQEMKSQNKLLADSYKFVSREYEELKCEKITMDEKVFSVQRAVLVEEDCRRRKNALEEKILRLEGDLIARDALSVQDAEMKNELNQIKIVNSQMLMKVKHLEDVREDLQSRLQSLELEPKRTRQDEVTCSKSTSESQHESAQSTEINGERESECKMSVLEDELQEIQERYFQMSLKYAEVEDQREQLVMKLRAFNI